MLIFPAIDIKDGNCVRLVKGDYATAHKVAENPLKTALSFKEAGAKWIHMVDLDGAKSAQPENSSIFIQVAQNSGLKVELGGGIRSMDTVDYYIEHGISRVILGSAAVKNPAFVKEAVSKYGEKIAVGIDALNGMVAAEGWLDTSDINYIDLAKAMEAVGVKTIIFTDISKDGTLTGPNLQQLRAINEAVSCDIIASGGVSGIADIANIKALSLYGAICGKAIYTGDLILKEAIELADR
jgi:phosphoribosylformimino-5-aminoimidazole carboxamide ribotide isomerase